MSSNFKKQIIPLFRFSSPVNLPLWLFALPEPQLSYSEKVLYSLMIILCSANGMVRTNLLDLTQSIGMNQNTKKSALKELIKTGFIVKIKEEEVYSFEFYENKWMDGKYDEEL